jgi:hypothetical protein
VSDLTREDVAREVNLAIGQRVLPILRTFCLDLSRVLGDLSTETFDPLAMAKTLADASFGLLLTAQQIGSQEGPS